MYNKTNDWHKYTNILDGTTVDSNTSIQCTTVIQLTESAYLFTDYSAIIYALCLKYTQIHREILFSWRNFMYVQVVFGWLLVLRFSSDTKSRTWICAWYTITFLAVWFPVLLFFFEFWRFLFYSLFLMSTMSMHLCRFFGENEAFMNADMTLPFPSLFPYKKHKLLRKNINELLKHTTQEVGKVECLRSAR